MLRNSLVIILWPPIIIYCLLPVISLKNTTTCTFSALPKVIDENVTKRDVLFFISIHFSSLCV